MFKRAVLIFVLLFFPFTAYARDKVLTVIYTGGIKGELEPCGCSPKTESGGIARLAGYISAHREGLAPYVLIDAGNSMSEDTPQGRLKAEALLNSFNIIGYDAAAFLKPDLLPEGFISPIIMKYRIPALYGGAGDRKSVAIERGPFRINISTDAEDHKRGRLNILLTGRPISEARSLKGWDIIVTSSGEILEDPLRAGKTVIVSGYPKDKKLGILAVQTAGDGTVSKFTHRWQPLGKDIKEDASVRDVLRKYDSKVALLVKDEERKPASNGPYLGVSSCAACHQPFMESWKNTRHAKAFHSLENAGKSKDPECVKCHTTGYGEAGGFYSSSTTPELVNVQCEVCHGPGKDHAADFTNPMRPAGKETCLRCHTKENSPDFDFKSYFEKIRHK